MSIPVLSLIEAGKAVVLATRQTETSPVAQCAHPGCPTAIQRTVAGTLQDGVRAHYRTVHPERKIR